jgi:hypothetical protein
MIADPDTILEYDCDGQQNTWRSCSFHTPAEFVRDLLFVPEHATTLQKPSDPVVLIQSVDIAREHSVRQPG